MHQLKHSILLGLVIAVVCLIVLRGYTAIADLLAGDQTRFLAFPLTVILPGSAFVYLSSRRDMASQEGVLMQLGAMIQILLIVALPDVALHLALGFPVVFLVAVLFESQMPAAF